ncbi:hypothetical protein [Demequina sp.]
MSEKSHTSFSLEHRSGNHRTMLIAVAWEEMSAELGFEVFGNV